MDGLLSLTVGQLIELAYVLSKIDSQEKIYFRYQVLTALEKKLELYK